MTMPDADFEAARAELGAALDARVKQLVTAIFDAQIADGTKRDDGTPGTSPYRTFVTDGNNRIVRIERRTEPAALANAIFDAQVEDGSKRDDGKPGTSPFRTFVTDGNARIVRIEAAVTALVADVAAIRAKLNEKG